MSWLRFGALSSFLALVALAIVRWAPWPFVGLFLLGALVFGVLAWKATRPGIRAACVNLAAIFGLGLGLELFALATGPRHPEPVRFEGSYEGSGYFVADPLLGYAPEAGRVVRSIKYKGKQLVYDATYTIGPDARRVTPDAASNDDRCVLFFGGSFTFGEGVNDAQSMPYRVGLQISVKVHNLGFHGYGPHQMLAAIEGGRIDCRPVAVIYQALHGHVGRVLGYSDWDENGPRYQLVDGSPVRRGRFSDAQEPIRAQKEAAKSGPFDHSLFFRRYVGRELHYESDDYRLFGTVVEASMRLLQDQFPDATFDVILWPGRGRDSVVKAIAEELRERNITVHHIEQVIPDHAANSARYHIPRDGHPTAAAHAAIADYVARDILPHLSAPSSGEAVDAVQRHVDQQADANEAPFARDQQQHVERDRRPLVQRVKADAAALRIVDRIGQQVIKVHQHGGDHDQPGLPESLASKETGDQRRHQKVQGDMKHIRGSSTATMR